MKNTTQRTDEGVLVRLSIRELDLLEQSVGGQFQKCSPSDFTGLRRLLDKLEDRSRYAELCKGFGLYKEASFAEATECRGPGVCKPKLDRRNLAELLKGPFCKCCGNLMYRRAGTDVYECPGCDIL